jgi:FkbM family methyltransferase
MQAFWYRTFPRATFVARRLVGASYEREMQLLDVLCDRNKTGIDIGAKVGMYTYRIRANSAEVVAFEPIPLFHNMLKRVFEGKRGRIEPYAVSNKRGSAVLRMPYDQGGGAQFGRSTIDVGNKLEHHVVASVRELEVETRTLDDYDFDAVGFIKIDVEGHEMAVLEGAEKTIARHHPNLLVECNDDHAPNGVANLTKWMQEHGYSLYFLHQRVIRPVAEYDRNVHWKDHTIENFICVHESRPEVVKALHERAARTSLRRAAV